MKNLNTIKHITNTRRPIIYPSGEIIGHDERYKHRNQMQENKNHFMSFDYPKNKDKTISNFALKILLVIFLAYAYSKQEDTLAQYVFIIFIFVILVQTLIELKTFYYINKISLNKDYFILQKNQKIHSKTLLSDLAFKVTINPIDISGKIIIDFYEQNSKKHLMNFKSTDVEDTTFKEFVNNLSKISNRDTNDFLITSHNQLISFLPESMDEVTMQGEFIKYTNNAFFTKYKVLVIIGITIVVALTLHLLRD